jgi:hypothetical protein
MKYKAKDIENLLRQLVRLYVSDEGYLVNAQMACDLILEYTKRELGKKYPNLILEGIHTRSFKILASFKSAHLSIHEPVNFHLNFVTEKQLGLDPTGLYVSLLEIFETKPLFEGFVSDKWIQFEGFSNPSFLFSSTVRTFGGINYRITPSVSTRPTESSLSSHLKKKMYEGPIEDFTPFISCTLALKQGANDLPIFEWEKNLSLAFLAWFENETREVNFSYNKAFEDLSYRVRPFRLSVTILIFLKIHLVKYKSTAYTEDIILLVTYLCGVIFSQREVRKSALQENYFSFFFFQDFVDRTKELIQPKPASSEKGKWWLSHPCDDQANLIKAWNDVPSTSLQFFEWLDLLSYHFSESELEKSSLTPEGYLKRLFLPIFH